VDLSVVVVLLLVVDQVVVGQSAGHSEGHSDTVAAHRLHACPCEDACGLPGDCRDIRDSLAGFPHQATISAFRFRSFQNGT